MNIVICCPKNYVKGQNNIVKIVADKQKDINVRKTYTVINDKFIHEIEYDLRPHKILIVNEVPVKSRRYSDIKEIISELREDARGIEIIYALGICQREYAHDMIKFLIDNGVYSIARGRVATQKLKDLVILGSSKEEAEKLLKSTSDDSNSEQAVSMAETEEVAEEAEESNDTTEEIDLFEDIQMTDDDFDKIFSERFPNAVENAEKDIAETELEETLKTEETEGTEKTEEEEIVSEVSESTEVEEKSESINFVECKKCHKTISADALYCNFCGTKNAPIYCKKCGTELHPDSFFCSKCGTPVNEKNENADMKAEDNFIEVFEDEKVDEVEELIKSLEAEPLVIDADDKNENDFYSDEEDSIREEIFNYDEENVSEDISLSDDVSESEKEDNEASIADEVGEESHLEEQHFDLEVVNDFSDLSVSENRTGEKAVFEAVFSDSQSDLHTWERVQEYERDVKQIIGCVDVGIAELINRTGCTHISIEMANMLFKDGYDVGIAFANPVTFEAIKSFINVVNVDENEFLYNGLHYYNAVAMSYAHSQHQILICDYGVLNDVRTSEFERSQVKVMICDSSAWNIESMNDFILNSGKRYIKEIRYIMNLTSQERFRNLIENPLKKEGFKTFNTLMSDSVFMPCKHNQDTYYRVLDSIISNDKLTRKKKGIFGLLTTRR